MSILFGHPTGNPNSHHAALAHFEAGRLEAFCVPWMPMPRQLQMIGMLPRVGGFTPRLRRRYFEPLAVAPRIEGKVQEWGRMLRRVAFGGHLASEKLSYEANDWLMRVMSKECRRPAVTAVHAYEDCAAWSFDQAKRLGKICIYDLPIGYYPFWEHKQSELVKRYADWLPPGGLPQGKYVRPEQKVREMELADLVLVPCTFVEETVSTYLEKRVVRAPYGVDLNFWRPGATREGRGPLRFVYAGQSSLRKGIPVLLEAWKRANLKDAQLELVGSWQFTPQKLAELPLGVGWTGPQSPERLRASYQASDVFVFPSFFEGFGLVILEAMACGLPVITTEATAGPDILDKTCGKLFKSGDVDALTELLCWFSSRREELTGMATAARMRAETYTWEQYRRFVNAAVDGIL